MRRIANTMSEFRRQLTESANRRTKSLGAVASSASKQAKTEYRTGGYTIVELITAMTVGVIIMGSAFLILVSQLHLSQRGRDLVLMNSYVENKIESMRSKGYLGLSNGTTNIGSELPTELALPATGTMEITTSSTGLKKIDIDINYNDQGTNRVYLYTTYVGELGVGQY